MMAGGASGRLPSSFRNPQPFMPGMLMSDTITSGRKERSSWSASGPLEQAATS